MTITKTDIFKGCLIASIAHAIMTNVYPELSYEQSWDGANYSMQDSSGLRGTITFESDYCVGAIRNDNSGVIASGNDIQKLMKCFPMNIAHKAYEETLQYLLLEKAGVVEPCITSIFWADEITIFFEDVCLDSIKRDFLLFENVILSREMAMEKWKEYYGMDSKAMELLNYLYQIKTKDFTAKIVLSEEQKQLIPGKFINSECVESLKELNIYL